MAATSATSISRVWLWSARWLRVGRQLSDWWLTGEARSRCVAQEGALQEVLQAHAQPTPPVFKVEVLSQSSIRSEKPPVRKTPSWPRSWANFSLLQMYPHRNAWANLHILGRPNNFLAPSPVLCNTPPVVRSTRRAGKTRVCTPGPRSAERSCPAGNAPS